jgi:hypothetical protein
MRTAMLTFTLSTDSRVAHIGKWFADFRVNGRQNTRVGDEKVMQKYLDDVRKQCVKYNVSLTVNNNTLGELKLN